MALFDFRFGPERPDELKLDELADHPHGVRAWLAFLASFQALGVATASPAIKVRDAWMDV